jgi:hypothetical protein
LIILSPERKFGVFYLININHKKKVMKLKHLITTICLICLTTKLSNGISNKNRFEFIYHKISYSSLYKEILKLDLLFPDVVFAQALLESGHFSSEVFKSENNLFGMKYPRQRATTSLKKGKTGYANYIHWTQSVHDYKLWQTNMISGEENINKEQYLRLLGRVYAEDKKYILKLKSIISKV